MSNLVERLSGLFIPNTAPTELLIEAADRIEKRIEKLEKALHEINRLGPGLWPHGGDSIYAARGRLGDVAREALKDDTETVTIYPKKTNRGLRRFCNITMNLIVNTVVNIVVVSLIWGGIVWAFG